MRDVGVWPRLYAGFELRVRGVDLPLRYVLFDRVPDPLRGLSDVPLFRVLPDGDDTPYAFRVRGV